MFWSDFPAGMKGEIVKYPRNKYKVDFHNRNVTLSHVIFTLISAAAKFA